MKKMIYTSSRGKRIKFDSWTEDRKENGIYWVNMCSSCHRKYRGILGKRAEKCACDGLYCEVCDCGNIGAAWYVNFAPNEVVFE